MEGVMPCFRRSMEKRIEEHLDVSARNPRRIDLWREENISKLLEQTLGRDWERQSSKESREETPSPMDEGTNI